MRKYLIIVLNGLISNFFSFEICLFVSESRKNIINISIKLSNVISQKGAFTHIGKINDQIIGQIINHIPKSHHKIHILCILSSFVFEMSFIIDWIILIFHQVIQFITLHNKNTQNNWLILIINEEIKLQTIHKSKIHFLQYLSDNCHKIGQNKNEKNANKTIA